MARARIPEFESSHPLSSYLVWFTRAPTGPLKTLSVDRLGAADRGIGLHESKVEVVSRMAAFDSTAQCETRSARAPAEKNARASPDSASAPGLSPAMVLQADSTTQSALSLSCATSLVVRRSSSVSLGSEPQNTFATISARTGNNQGHSITSSARAVSASGNVIPSAVALFRLSAK
jgi:hypothetical protein